MTPWRWLALATFSLYAAALVVLEWNTSQDFVRNFFTDIEGPVPLYGLNTTLTAFLFWATALLFAVCASASRTSADARLRGFFASQVAIFAFVGFDDRFLVHERVGFHLGVGDHWALLAVAAGEGACLALLGARRALTPLGQRCFVGAGVMFAAMLALDALAPHEMRLRLSLEDLCKAAAALLLFYAAWDTCLAHVQAGSSPAGRSPRPLAPLGSNRSAKVREPRERAGGRSAR